MVSTNWEISLGNRSSSLATRSAVGNVAFELEVAKAVSMASEISTKNCRGERPPSFQTTSEYTTATWIAIPATAVITNQASVTKISAPSWAVIENIRHATQ